MFVDPMRTSYTKLLPARFGWSELNLKLSEFTLVVLVLEAVIALDRVDSCVFKV